MQGVEKILIVGETGTGKTSIVQEFMNYDGDLTEKTENKRGYAANRDFQLKIMHIEGTKVRMQLWD